MFQRRGWRVDWSGHGSISDIVARWSSRTLSEALRQDADVDLSRRLTSLDGRIEKLRRALTTEPIDAANVSAPAAASQKAIELKQRRHKMSDELRTLRAQYEQTKELLASLEHRIHGASDLLRLKTTGVGRLDQVECPTCHRDLDPSTFALTLQSEDMVSAHIEALKRDRELINKNLRSLEANLAVCTASLEGVDSELRDAERALMTVNLAIGTVREQVAQIAADLSSAEREVDQTAELSKEIDELQGAIKRWIADALAIQEVSVTIHDLESRRNAFLEALRRYLAALGHSAVRPDNEISLDLDDQYVPHLNNRRLRSLGSASDQSRLVAAYSFGLAAASQNIKGLHPGIVIMDEPLQQNPDPHHRELFLAFLSQELARQAKFQTLIFTSLRDEEIQSLRQSGTNVLTPTGDHFLKIISPTVGSAKA